MGGAPGYSTEVLSGDTENQGASLSQDKVTSLSPPHRAWTDSVLGCGSWITAGSQHSNFLFPPPQTHQHTESFLGGSSEGPLHFFFGSRSGGTVPGWMPELEAAEEGTLMTQGVREARAMGNLTHRQAGR